MENLLNTSYQKPISAGAHGLIDYGFAVATATIPLVTGADRKTTKLYALLAGQILLYSVFTKQPYAIKGLIPFSTHRKIDVANLIGLAALSAYKGISRNKPTLLAHLSLLALGVTTVLLTDWSGKE